MGNKALQTAIQYAERGWFVFPVQSKQKIPFSGFKWKEWSTSNIELIKRAAEHPRYKNANWALDCGKSNVFVVDVDKESINVVKDFPHLFDANFIVETPSPGMHFYYKGLKPSSISKIMKGVDTRGQGGYVLIPGSVNGEGKEYQRMTVGPFELDPIPQWIIDQLSSISQEKKPERETALVELDQDQNIQHAIHYLQHEAPMAVEGQGGDNTTYQVACRLRDLGLSQETAYGLILTYWNDQKAFPPWPGEELNRKIHNAYQYAKDQPGNATIEAMFPDASPQTSKIPLVDMEELLLLDLPEEPHLMTYLLPSKSIIMICGDPKIGKTKFALDIIMHGISGLNYLDTFKVPKAFKAVFIESEDTLRGMQESIQKIKDTKLFPHAPGKLKILTDRFDISRQEGRDILEQILQQENPQLLFIDPLTHFHTRNENSPEDMGILLTYIRRLTQKYNTSFLIVHHANKNPEQTGGGRIRGSSAIFAGLDTYIDLERSKEKGQFKVSFDFRKSPPLKPRIVVRDPISLTHFIEREEGKLKIRDIEEVLKEFGPLKASFLYTHLEKLKDCSPTTVKHMLKEAVKKKAIIKGRDSKDARKVIYMLNPEEPAFKVKKNN